MNKIFTIHNILLGNMNENGLLNTWVAKDICVDNKCLIFVLVL